MNSNVDYAKPVHDANLINRIHTPTTVNSPSSSRRARLESTPDEQASSKKIRIGDEEPSLYSDNVRRKLAATTRTGQACDRCKERKMKCDPDPTACQPCRQKTLKCFTTDRVTGHARERGQSDRVDHQLLHLQEQLQQYQDRYGPLSAPPPHPHPHPATSSLVPQHDVQFEPQLLLPLHVNLPQSQYVGWPSRDPQDSLHRGPVEGTKANILDWGVVDSGDFECEFMREPMNDDIEVYNFSTTSILKTIYQRQKIQFHDLQLPSKDEALEIAEIFLSVMWSYYPVVHKVAFTELVNRFYDASQSVTLPEKIQVVQMLGVLNHQFAIRNQDKADKIKDSHRYFHYALGHFPDLIKDTSLPAMQALALILMQFRNMPRPGYTWNLAQELLQRCIHLDYHRDPENIQLPPDQQNALSKEMRKRVFHGVIGICIATGFRLGRPAPWQFVQWDVPLPNPLLDSELSEHGIQANLSGKCDFWGALQLAKLLPLYTELYNYVLSVRRSPREYAQIVDILKAKIDAWKADWDKSTSVEDQCVNLTISSLIVETWAAEFIILLHHPSVCVSSNPEVTDRNLDACHKGTKRLLSSFHKLSRQYKAADFSWHTTVTYTLAFGLVLHIYRRRNGTISQEQYNAVKNELAGWISLMAYTDLVLRTDNMLHKYFAMLVEQVQREVAARVVHSGQPDTPTTRLSVGGPSDSSGRSNPVVKQEHAPYAVMTSRNLLAPPNGHMHLIPSHQLQHGQSSGYPTPQHSINPVPYNVYASMPATQYPALPNSLAPLLNEAPPSSAAQYSLPMLSVQDPAMMFSPHLYTGPAAMWPLMPEE